MNKWYSAAGNKDMYEVDDNTCINAIPSNIIWRNVGLPYGKMLSLYHIILEANEVYENIGSMLVHLMELLLNLLKLICLLIDGYLLKQNKFH